MNRKTRFVIFCILLFIIGGCSRSDSRAYTPPGGEFSYVPPERWMLRDLPGYKYKFATGQPSDGFAPNIGVVDEYAPVTLDEYVADGLRAMPQIHEKMGTKTPEILSQADFTTDSNQRAIKVITAAEMGGKKLRQTYYFFDGAKGNKFVVTCSVLDAGGESYDSLFEASMKTFNASRD